MVPQKTMIGPSVGPLSTHVGTPYKSRTKLAGPQLSAQMQALWALYGCAGWVVAYLTSFLTGYLVAWQATVSK